MKVHPWLFWVGMFNLIVGTFNDDPAFSVGMALFCLSAAVMFAPEDKPVSRPHRSYGDY